MKCALHFLFKNHFKCSSVERDIFLRIWGLEMAFCPATRAKPDIFQVVCGHAFTIIFLLEILIILKNFQHKKSIPKCEGQFCFRKFLKIILTFWDIIMGRRYHANWIFAQHKACHACMKLGIPANTWCAYTHGYLSHWFKIYFEKNLTLKLEYVMPSPFFIQTLLRFMHYGERYNERKSWSWFFAKTAWKCMEFVPAKP